MGITIEQLKDYVREALQSTFEWRCGLGSTGDIPLLMVEAGGDLVFAAPEAMAKDNIAAANLLARLVDDVDNLDPVIACTVLGLLNSCGDPTAIFRDGRFSAVIEPIGLRNQATGKYWRPATVTDVLRYALATAQL